MKCLNKTCQLYLECLNDPDKYFRFNIIKKLGPVLLGQKPIHLFCFREDFKYKDEILNDVYLNFDGLKNIKYEIIHSCNDTVKILFYNVKNIKKVLKCQKKRAFLSSIGLPDDMPYTFYLNHIIVHLRDNIIPPEIGIFFGYPVKDVIGYMGHPSLKLSFVKGWEYYGNPKLSEKVYKGFSKAEKLMTNSLINSQRKIAQIVKSIDQNIA